MDLWQYGTAVYTLVKLDLHQDCADQISTLRTVLKHRFKYLQHIVTCFIDFAAFDSINRTHFGEWWNDEGIPKIIWPIKLFYHYTSAYVCYEVLTNPNKNCHGCALFHAIFNKIHTIFMMDWIMDYGHYLLALTMCTNPQHNIKDPEYADVVLLPTVMTK